MPSGREPRSLVAERAVRFLADESQPVPSTRLLAQVLAVAAAGEANATRVLSAAFAGDARLTYDARGWRLTAPSRGDGETEPETALLWIDGEAPSRGAFALRAVAVVVRRRSGGLDAAAGEILGESSDLREEILGVLSDAIPVIHASRAAIGAFERWIGAPLGRHVALRRLASDRLRLPAGHSLEDLVARLGVEWRDGVDAAERLDAVGIALDALRGPEESLESLIDASAKARAQIDWRHVAFDRRFLASLPPVPGIYRFYDAADGLLYVGKSRNLRHRVRSYFLGELERSPTRRGLPSRVHRIEIEPTGSELQAVLAEARWIARRRPPGNVQRKVHRSGTASARLDAVVILEPGSGRAVLRAFFVRCERLVATVSLGARGGGVRRVERILQRWYFEPPPPLPHRLPDLDVELLARWLGRHRDRVVAFDPRDLGSVQEVVARLRWFLGRGTPFEPDGTPIRPR